MSPSGEGFVAGLLSLCFLLVEGIREFSGVLL